MVSGMLAVYPEKKDNKEISHLVMSLTVIHTLLNKSMEFYWFIMPVNPLSLNNHKHLTDWLAWWTSNQPTYESKNKNSMSMSVRFNMHRWICYSTGLSWAHTTINNWAVCLGLKVSSTVSSNPVRN